MTSKNKIELSIDEKIRLFNGQGWWKTYSADGKLPSITMSDGPHGLRKQGNTDFGNLNNSIIATCFPTASCAASSWDRDCLKLLGKSIAYEAQKEDVNLVLGPGINIKRSPLCGRNFEYFSEDPFLAGHLATSYITGMQSEGIGCCVKHFACNNQEKHRQTSSSMVDERTLHEIYLSAFEYVVKNAKPASIMCSYNLLNGTYVCHNKKLLTDILRKKWNYQGAVISDWGACINPAKCVQAGLDLAMPDSSGYFDRQLKSALKNGEIEISEIEQANERVINLINDLKSSMKSNQNLDFASQHLNALKIAESSAVLLKNDNFYPLSKGKILIIGKMAEQMRIQGGGSSHINCKTYPNAIDSLKNKGFDVIYTPGYALNSSKKDENKQLICEAIQKVKLAVEENTPILLFCGLTDYEEGESFDRSTLDLPKNQIELINQLIDITSNFGTVTFSGSPMDIYFEDKTRAILHMYLAGEAAGEACANLISGEVSPSGKLAESFPYKIEDTPCYNHFGGEKTEIDYNEGIFVGYRHYETKNIPVRFCFGHGLTYTKFEYSDLKVNLPNISFNITNIGDYDAYEIAQLYISPEQNDETSLNPHFAKKQLKGFEKVFIKKGDRVNVSITLDDRAFSSFSVEKDDFVQIKGNYSIMVGSSVQNILLESKVSIEGQEPETVVSAPVVILSEKREKSEKRFTIHNTLGDMAKKSILIRLFLFFAKLAIYKMNKNLSKDDPAVKIALNGITETPLESLISTSGGMISEPLAKFLVKLSKI